MVVRKVKWKASWLNRKDANDRLCTLWASQVDSQYFKCSLCHDSSVSFSSGGFQALFQHSAKKKHKSQSDVLHSEVQPHLIGRPVVINEEQHGVISLDDDGEVATAATKKQKEILMTSATDALPRQCDCLRLQRKTTRSG